MDQNRDWDRQPYLLVHESVPVSFDISNTLLDWSHINIARVIDALHILQAPDADGTELNKQYRAHGVLMDIWHNDVNQITCLRPAVTGAMSSSYRLLLPPGQCATEAELDLCGFWCDRATAKNFFISGDIHYAPWTSGIYVFLMPRRIVSELGTICPETNRFRLNQNTKIIPVVTNMYRMFGAIQSGYDAEAIESGLYRIAFAQQPNGNSNKLTMIFRTYVNIPMLYRHLENGDTIPSRALLVTHLSKQLESTLNSLRFHGGHSVIDRFKTFVNHPMKSSPREKSAVMTLLKSNGAPLSFKPYDYQFDNVAHIVRVEQAVDDGDWSVKGRKLWNPVRPIHLGYKDMGFLCAEK